MECTLVNMDGEDMVEVGGGATQLQARRKQPQSGDAVTVGLRGSALAEKRAGWTKK